MFWSEKELEYAEAPLLSTVSCGVEKHIQEAKGLGYTLVALCTSLATSLWLLFPIENYNST